MTEEVTIEEYQNLLKKPSKYGAKKTEVDGYVFDSRAEASHYSELKMREKAGEIFDLELQPRFECKVSNKLICTYIADFRYKEWTGEMLVTSGIGGKKIATKDFEIVIIDVKGMKTPVYRLKKKLVEALYDIEIKEIT